MKLTISITLLTIVALSLTVLFIVNRESKPKAALDLTEPNWSLLSDGKWSPWITDDSGNKIWNPSASYNAWMDTIPIEEKAWPVLAEVYFEHFGFFIRVASTTPEQHGEDLDRDGADDWDQMVQVLKSPEMQQSITQANAALQKPYMGEWLHSPPGVTLMDELAKYKEQGFYELGLNPSTNPMINPWIRGCNSHSRIALSSISKLLTSNSAHLAETGRINECVEQIVIILNCTAFAQERPNLMYSLQSAGIQSRALGVLRWALSQYGDQFSDEHLIALDRAIESNFISQVNTLEDQLAFHDTTRRMYTYSSLERSTDLIHGGLSDVTPMSTPYTKLKEPIREVLAFFDMPLDGVSAASKNREQYKFDLAWLDNFDDFESLEYSIDSFGRSMLDYQIPKFGGLALNIISAQSYSDAMRLVIAIHRHKLRHGRFPGSIDVIDSDLLTIVTVDPFTKKQLHYRLSDELGPMVYALGTDGDDDLGQHNGLVQVHFRSTEGDFLYYPNPWTIQSTDDELED